MEHDQRYGHDIPFVPHQGHWHETPGYHPHHHSPQHGYPIAGFVPMTTNYEGQVLISPRSDHQHTFSYPPFPSMLAATYVSNAPNQPVHYVPLASPISNSTSSVSQYTSKSPPQQAPVQRKMLSDADRRKMCQYHADNPTKKQTEIGEIFGVERSTVSKVLRQKERYLMNDDEGSRAPVKKPKGKLTELERALVNWARKREKEGVELTDEMIKHRAACFSYVTRNGAAVRESIYDPHWLKEFKSKNKIGMGRSRKNSISKRDSPSLFSSTPVPISQDAQTAVSPVSLGKLSSAPTTNITNSDAAQTNTKSNNFDPPTTGYHSESNNSLSSAYGGTTTTTFSNIDSNITSSFAKPETTTAESMANGTAYFSLGTSPPKSSPQGAPLLMTTPAVSLAQTEPSSWNHFTMSPQQLDDPNDTPVASHGLMQGNNLSNPSKVQTQSSTSSNTNHSSTQLPTSLRGSNQNQNINRTSLVNETYPISTTDISVLSPALSSNPPAAHERTPHPTGLPSKDDVYAALETILLYLKHKGAITGIQPQDVATIAKLRDTIRLKQ